MDTEENHEQTGIPWTTIYFEQSLTLRLRQQLLLQLLLQQLQQLLLLPLLLLLHR